MYKSIMFDLGGVMVDFAPHAYLVDRICNEEIEEQVYDLTFGSEEWKQLDAGLSPALTAISHAGATPKPPAAGLRCRACWTTGCTSCARAAGCRSWCAA